MTESTLRVRVVASPHAADDPHRYWTATAEPDPGHVISAQSRISPEMAVRLLGQAWLGSLAEFSADPAGFVGDASIWRVRT